MAYINKKEFQALNNAWEYVNNIYEGCEPTEENKDVLILLEDTLNGLESLQKKYKP